MNLLVKQGASFKIMGLEGHDTKNIGMKGHADFMSRFRTITSPLIYIARFYFSSPIMHKMATLTIFWSSRSTSKIVTHLGRVTICVPFQDEQKLDLAMGWNSQTHATWRFFGGSVAHDHGKRVQGWMIMDCQRV